MTIHQCRKCMLAFCLAMLVALVLPVNGLAQSVTIGKDQTGDTDILNAAIQEIRQIEQEIATYAGSSETLLSAAQKLEQSTIKLRAIWERREGASTRCSKMENDFMAIEKVDRPNLLSRESQQRVRNCRQRRDQYSMGAKVFNEKVIALKEAYTRLEKQVNLDERHVETLVEQMEDLKSIVQAFKDDGGEVATPGAAYPSPPTQPSLPQRGGTFGKLN